MTEIPQEGPIEPGNGEMGEAVTGTTDQLAGAVQAALDQFAENVVYEPGREGDRSTGGDSLTLYPNPEKPKEVITIRAVGANAEERRLDGITNTVRIVYRAGKGVDGKGAYDLTNDDEGGITVLSYQTHPQLGHEATLAPRDPEDEAIVALAKAIDRSTPEEPAGRIRRRLGSVAAKVTRS